MRRRLSALELAPAAVGRPVAQPPMRVLEAAAGLGRGSAPVGAEKSSAHEWGVFGLTHGSAPRTWLFADLRSARLCRAGGSVPGRRDEDRTDGCGAASGSTWSLSVAVDPCPSPSDGPAGCSGSGGAVLVDESCAGGAPLDACARTDARSPSSRRLRGRVGRGPGGGGDRCSGRVVVEEPAELAFVPDDGAVEELMAQGPHPAFGVGIRAIGAWGWVVIGSIPAPPGRPPRGWGRCRRRGGSSTRLEAATRSPVGSSPWMRR